MHPPLGTGPYGKRSLTSGTIPLLLMLVLLFSLLPRHQLCSLQYQAARPVPTAAARSHGHGLKPRALVPGGPCMPGAPGAPGGPDNPGHVRGGLTGARPAQSVPGAPGVPGGPSTSLGASGAPPLLIGIPLTERLGGVSTATSCTSPAKDTADGNVMLSTRLPS